MKRSAQAGHVRRGGTGAGEHATRIDYRRRVGAIPTDRPRGRDVDWLVMRSRPLDPLPRSSARRRTPPSGRHTAGRAVPGRARRAPGAAGAPAAPPAAPILGLDGKPDTLPDAAFVETVRQQCSKCHVVPQPQYLPRGMWRLRIQEMAQRSLMGTGVTPGEESVLWQMDTAQFVRYFEARSPVTLPLPDPWPQGDGGLRFSHQAGPRRARAGVPVVANVRFFDLDGDGQLEIVACDMGHGIVYLGEPAEEPGELREIARIPNPDHAEMVDLDKDGKQDLLIADLGDFMPGDHEKGSIVWLRQTAPAAVREDRARRQDRAHRRRRRPPTSTATASSTSWWPRSAGTRSAASSSTRTRRPTGSTPKFEGYPVDARPGGIHVPIARPQRRRPAGLRRAHLAAVRARRRVHQPRRRARASGRRRSSAPWCPSGARPASSSSTWTRTATSTC